MGDVTPDPKDKEKESTQEPVKPGPGNNTPVIEAPKTDAPNPKKGKKDEKKPPAPADNKPKGQPKKEDEGTTYSEKWMKSFQEMNKAVSTSMDNLSSAMGDKAKDAFNKSDAGKKINAALDEFKSELDGLKKRVGEGIDKQVGKITDPISNLANKAVNKLADGIVAAIGKGTSAIKPKEGPDEPDKDKEKAQEEGNDEVDPENSSELVGKVKNALGKMTESVTSPSLEMSSPDSSKKTTTTLEQVQGLTQTSPKPKPEGEKEDLDEEADKTQTNTF